MNLIELLISFNKNNENFEDIYSHFKVKIDFLISSFQIEVYKSDLLSFLWQLIKKINISNFKSEQALYTYISVSLKNHCMNLYSKQSRNNKIIYNSILTNFEIDKNNSCNCMDNSSLIFDDLISKLSENQKKVITMRYKYCFSDCEIANALNISRQAVYKSRKFALTSLQKTCKLSFCY